MTSPKPRPKVDPRPMLEALACVVRERGAVYVSAPITTGRRLQDWHAAGRPGSHETSVRKLNVEAASLVVQQVRERWGGVVIDPTALPDQPGWEQPDYHAFWVDIVARFTRAVVLVDGWESSEGCLREMAAALDHAVALFDQRLEPLGASALVCVLREAHGSGDVPEPVRAILDRLGALRPAVAALNLHG